jgi:hypothetical protein
MTARRSQDWDFNGIAQVEKKKLNPAADPQPGSPAGFIACVEEYVKRVFDVSEESVMCRWFA